MQTSGVPRPGDVIGGKYRVEREIGAGGMGCVLEAEHTLLRQRVAIKLLLPHASALPGATERFLREAQATAALRGDNVTRVLDLGTNPNGSAFLVMEYLAGNDLRRILRERAPLPVEEAAEYILQACDALLEAHSLGIVHRDIKPSNLFVTSRPNGARLLKVLDFGLAKVLSPEGDCPEPAITQTGTIMGSLPYMPPEQYRSLRDTDARSDIWSIGVVLYECLTGKRPFPGMSAEVAGRVLRDDPAPLSAHRADLPEAVDHLVMRCLRKRPEDRPQSVAELIEVLEPYDTRRERAFSAWKAPALPEEPVTPLVDRTTLRIAPKPRRSAADELTGVYPADTSSGLVSAPQSGAVGGGAGLTDGSLAVLERPLDDQRPSARTPPETGSDRGGEPAEITDLSQASTRPKPPTRRVPRSSRARQVIFVGLLSAAIVAMIAGLRCAGTAPSHGPAPSAASSEPMAAAPAEPPAILSADPTPRPTAAMQADGPSPDAGHPVMEELVPSATAAVSIPDGPPRSAPTRRPPISTVPSKASAAPSPARTSPTTAAPPTGGVATAEDPGAKY